MTIQRMLAKSVGFVVLCVLFTLTAFSQTKTITGKVSDDKGAPIQGATVAVKGTKSGASTGLDGTYRITVPAGASTLVISSVGYKSQEVAIGDQASIDVALVSSSASLNEVVVVGYGTVRKKDLTGSVASVQAKDFNKGTFTAPDQLIQGKVSGVQVINNSGAPGGGTTVKVRGNSAITGSGQPLYVLDGIPLDGRSARGGLVTPNLGGAGGDKTNTPAGNPLNFINPSDIASIDVLKDASATAIYGSRAAYGVVIITTRRGASGQPKLDLSASVGASKIMRQIKVLNAAQYAKAIDYYGVAATNNYGKSVDAMDAIMHTGINQTYNAAISGGNENGKYRLSLGYLDQQGIIRKTDFKKYSVGFNSNFKFLENRRLGLDLNIITNQYGENIAPITNNAGASGSLIGQALQWNPTRPLKIGDSLNNFEGTIVNPLSMQEGYTDKSKVTTALASISPYYKITDNLEYRMLFSINYSTGDRRAMLAPFLIALPDIKHKGWAGIATSELVTQQVTHTINYNKQVTDNLSVNAVVGYEYMKFSNKGTTMAGFGPGDGSATSAGFGNYGLDLFNYIQYSNTANRTISSFVDPTYELQSYFARVVLNWKDRYFLTGTFRADGSSKFGENNRYGYFPSVAAAWNVTKESFWSSEVISQLKLRAGWGKTGNQEFPPGSARARYTFRDNGGLGQTNSPNPNLKWQSDKQYNFGLDFGILNNRFSGTVDYFHKATSDLLFPSTQIDPAPPTNVILWKNLAGLVVNKGVEVSLTGAIIQGKDFTWDLSVNATFIKNMVSGLPAPIQTGALSGQGVSGTLVETIRNGYAINSFWTRIFEGLDKTTGQAVYKDNGNIFYYAGNPNPSTLLGLSTTLAYKKLSLTVNMNGALGQKIYNNTLNNVLNVGSINGGRNIALTVFNSPIKEAFSNPVTSSSRFIESGSYLKMANSTLSYSIGNISKWIKGANVFVTGQNLFVITKFKGFDPEVNVDEGAGGVNAIPSVGIEYMPYPTARTFTLGLNFSL
ncbi:SusC/RagA family TonB-linked outer membrane protein [Flavitalea sp. BT771]|uniref:SusC/RagA family TonB-linked outer membrane protein n=1 Tax=Flavitalea sp. BT771 TaxID=3063329 RepID=UPI0026E2AF49|nr:SusC/RagA family TonB-linked outer membrane protein [Flavitalea sp. BT771]MDO6432051.1 SusC/RagA family TonB-linked outer membrane protein [Flavitalea sp. BT771]MDV6220960.1 SusC/RagA family TonB-linked outer membrane protein [Flavitalea sp. BT771]